MRTSPAHAYATLVTGPDYIQGALALVHSLQHHNAEADILIMHTPAVDAGELSELSQAGALIVEVQPLELSEAFIARHAKKEIHANRPFTKGEKPSFHTPLDNFCKLRLWELDDYDRIVFIDADAIAVRNLDRLFGYPEFSAAPNVYESLADFHRLNSGVFVAEPNKATFARMMNALDAPDAFWPRTDQTFLEHFFADWHGLPVFFNTLQYVWFNMPELWRWSSVHVVHYQYEKPWMRDHGRADLLKPLIDLWWRYRNNEDIPDTDSLPDPVIVPDGEVG